MGFFSEDMAPMLGVYEAETTELVGVMEAIASRAEREGVLSPQDVAELFRCAHTIKGSSAMMGLDALSSLTHALEDLFDLFRHDPSLAEVRIADTLDHLYSFGDYVKDEMARMEEQDFAPADASGLAADIAAYVAELSGGVESGQAGEQEVEVNRKAEPGDEPAATDVGADVTGEGGTVLRIDFKPDVPMVNARAMVIVRNLQRQAHLRSYVPEDLTSSEAAKVVATEGLLLVVDAADAATVRNLLAKNSFVRRVVVLEDGAATSAPARKGDDSSAATTPAAEKFVTLRWSSVRELQDLVGEFVSHVSGLKALCDDVPDRDAIRRAVMGTTRLADELAYHVDRMAMVSMSAMVPQLSRMVRDMCRSSDKRVSFEVHGGSIDIDRNLYNSISDPLVHIIRNAVDHGIESTQARLATGKEARGKVTLSIENLGARVAFRVADDGRGIDVDAVMAAAQAKGMLAKPRGSYTRAEALRMVMMPGLSTSGEVTQYSGRGVGMDVVSAVVRDFNGSVDIESEPGSGTTVTLFMPVSVSSVRCLAFRVGPYVCHMPLFNLNKIYSAAEAAEHVSDFEGSVLFEHDKRQVPVLSLQRLLGCDEVAAFYVVCHSLDEEFVIGVDDVLGEFGFASRPLPPCLGSAWQEECPIRNVSIMEDGMVGYMLNTPLLADYAHGRRPMPAVPEELELPDEGGQTLGTGVVPSMPTGAFVFELGEERYALPVEHVVRLSALQACTPVPRGLPHLMGLMNDRNRVIAVFDLAGSAGVRDKSSYVIVADIGHGDNVGLAITDAVGIQDLGGATPADEQPEPRALAAGLRAVAAVREDPKKPVVLVLAPKEE